MIERLKGREVTLTIFSDGKPVETTPVLNPLSGPSALERNLDRMAERVREEALAEFMATPEAKAAQAELLPEQIDGAVVQAGVRLRDFYKLHRVRTTPAQAKAERAQQRVDKREMARAIARGEPPF